MSDTTNTILVTGGCGYIGSALLRRLGAAGYAEIRILDNFSRGTPAALRNLPAGPRYRFYEADILNRDILRIALSGVDAVIHLAALAQRPLSFSQPDRLQQVNHWGTAGVVEQCLSEGVERLIYLSNTAVYGPGEKAAEDAVCRPLGPVAQSVLGAEESVRAANVRGLPATVFRIGTVYGSAPVMRFDEFVNRFVYLAGTRRPLTIYGEGSQKRPIIHIDDVCRAIEFSLANEDTRFATFNANEDNYAVGDVVKTIVDISDAASVRFTEQDLRTRYSFEVDDAKIRAMGWAPETTLSAGAGELLSSFSGFALPGGDDDQDAELASQ
jgi:nucleoside-diphosphate-sugar epimerase